MVRYVLAAAMAMMLASGSPGLAEDPKPQAAKPKSAEKALKERLIKLGDLAFAYEETPLHEIVDDLKTKLEIPIMLDLRAIEEASISPDQPISMSLPKVRADVALKLLLDPLDMTVDYSTGVAIITTNEKARTIVRTQYYDVRDLIAAVEQDEVKRRRQFGSPSTESKGDAGADDSEPKLSESSNVRKPIAGMMSAKDQMAKPAPKAVEFRPSDIVRQLVMNAIAPGSWEQQGGPGRVSIVAGVMVVHQTSSVHDEIEEMLSQVRAILKSPPNSGADSAGSIRGQSSY